MSWLLLNTILAIEIFIVFLIGINVRNLLSAIVSVREWMFPFNDDLMDIREEMSRFMDDVQARLVPMLLNFRYISVTATLAVFANIYEHPIVWLPFWASVGFTIESIVNLYQIKYLGDAFNINVECAEQTVLARTYGVQMHNAAGQKEQDG